MLCTPSFGQKKDSTYVGEVKGIVNDSVHNYVLPSTSVAIYKTAGNELLSYQLTNNFGEFHFKDLPVGIPLNVVISYSGYKNFSKKFIIPVNKKEIDLKKLVVERSDKLLDEVVIKYIPPVQMNGDTLEFNADAFKLDSNAVVEDLLRKLPGVTVWGDGEITVNGRKVNNVYVDGKPFFGGDTRVATQNLPKNAIDKIQVYKQENKENPLDSIMNVNIKLKANKKFGHFGKLGGGYGTDHRYEANASLNIFSPLTQFAVVGAANNINEQGLNINTLMQNASFKGVGANTDYMPDFASPGFNKSKAAGLMYQHDFIPDAGYQKNNRISANYFVNSNDNDNLRSTQTILNMGGDSNRIQEDNNTTRNVNTRHRFDSKYEFENNKMSLNISPSFNINKNDGSTSGTGSTFLKKGTMDEVLQSANSSTNENERNSKNVSLTAEYRKGSPNDMTRRPFKYYEVNYSFYAGDSKNRQLTKNEFVSYTDPTQNKDYDRRYNQKSNDINQSVFFRVNDLKRFIFNYKNLAGIDFQLQNYLYVNLHDENSLVNDKDSISKLYLANNYLTNRSNYHTINDMPGLNISKSFNKGLANRYSKSVSINILAQGQFFSLKNTSEKTFQNLERNYSKFVPGVGITYTNNQYGDYQTNYSLNYKASSDYPTVQQLAPLVDSSDLRYLQGGNPDLKAFSKKELTFGLSNSSYRNKNTFFYGFNINAGMVKDAIVDSSFFDNLGRTIHYLANADGNKYISLNGNLNKAYKFKENQIQINASTFLSFAKNPNYIKNVLTLSDNINGSGNLNIYYTLKDFLTVNAGQNISFYHSRQKGEISNEFKNSTKATNLSASMNITKKFSLSSNVKYTNSSSSGSKSIDFTIWNADATYRFLKGNNAEIKFSALDILHQNVSVISYGDNNQVTYGSQNILQQYFMIKLSYFPRKFGKKKKTEK